MSQFQTVVLPTLKRFHSLTIYGERFYIRLVQISSQVRYANKLTPSLNNLENTIRNVVRLKKNTGKSALTRYFSSLNLD